MKIHPALDGFKHRIGQALLAFYPRCRAVFRDFGIEGPLREPVRETIAGDKTQTVHRENGVLFKLDALKMMFSPGNLRERMRMSLLGKGETVVDMFAGIGYFLFPWRSIPGRVRSWPLSSIPMAHHYLCQNIQRNHVEEIVEPSWETAQKVRHPEKLTG